MATAAAVRWASEGQGYEFCNCDSACGSDFGGFQIAGRQKESNGLMEVGFGSIGAYRILHLGEISLLRC